MRRYLTVFVILGSLIFLTAGSTLALPLPWIDYSGAVKIENGIVDQTEVRINSVVYQNGETSTFWDLMSGSADPIIGQLVSIGDEIFTGLQNGESIFADNTFFIEEYFTADLVDIVVLSDGDVNPLFAANLVNVQISNTIDSRWLTELEKSVLAAGEKAATNINFQIASLNPNPDTIINVSGKVAPVPEPTTMLLLGVGLIGAAGLGRKRSFKK